MPSTNPSGASRHTDAEKIAILRFFDRTRRRQRGPLPTKGRGARGGRRGRMKLYRLFGISTGVLTKWRDLRRSRKIKAEPEAIETALRALWALIPPRPVVVKPERIVKRPAPAPEPAPPAEEPEPVVQGPPPFRFAVVEEEPW